MSGSGPAEDIVVKDGWYIHLGPSADSGSVAPSDVINFEKSNRVTLESNTFSGSTGAVENSIVHIPAGASDYVITHPQIWSADFGCFTPRC
jgi:hypothetical protein